MERNRNDSVIKLTHRFWKLSLAIGVLSMLLAFLGSPTAYKLPYVGKYLLARHYSYIASKFVPSSPESQRYSAIAKAVREGSSQYQFTTAFQPQ